MNEIKKLIREILLEKKKKRDRCLRIADRKYKKPSAYKSGAAERCRAGKIWKGIKEEIDPEEAYGDKKSIQTVIDGKRKLGFVVLDGLDSSFTERKFWDTVQNKNLGVIKVPSHPNRAYIFYRKGAENEANELKAIAEKYGGYLSYKATDEDARKIGQLLGYKAEAIEDYIEKRKTKLNQVTEELIREKTKETLRTWFKRKGAPGKIGGWVDCNSPIRKKGKITGYKACGRQKGEKRAKYPSCRPTPAKCKSPGKGTKWGKTK